MVPKRKGDNNQGGKEKSGGKSPGDKTVAALLNICLSSSKYYILSLNHDGILHCPYVTGADRGSCLIAKLLKITPIKVNLIHDLAPLSKST